MSEKVAVIFSGGLDSAVVIANELAKGHEVIPLVFDDDCVEFRTKTEVAVQLVLTHYGLYGKMQKIRLYNTERIMGNDQFGFIPGWKMAIQLAAMAHCQALGIKKCLYGYNEGNLDQVYADELPDNIKAMEELYNKIYDTDIKVLSPFYSATKAHMVALGEKLGVPFNFTVSCAKTYAAGIDHCGECELCRRRIEAFAIAEVKDTAYYRSTKMHDKVFKALADTHSNERESTT